MSASKEVRRQEDEPVVRNETIIPLIRVCRKIDACDTNQLATFLQQLPRIFDDNANSQHLKQFLRRGFCNDHASFSPAFFQALLDALPDEEALSVDDSITNSHPVLHLADAEETQPSSSPPSFLQLPKEIKIATFNYLHVEDIFSVQKVCRCLTVAARNPNSCFHLDFFVHKGLHYWHPCFSRVKHLEIQYENNRFNCPLFPAFYRSVTRLRLWTNRYLNNLIQKPFENLQLLSLNGNATLDKNWMQTLVLCRDLRRLDLGKVSVDPELVDTFAFPLDCFRNLTDITLRSDLAATFPRLVAALLTTGSEKDCTLDARWGSSAITNSHCALFGEGTKHLLLNIKTIRIKCKDDVYCKSLMSNLASAINSMNPPPAFDVDIYMEWNDLESIAQLQTVATDLKTILQRSKKSDLCLYYVDDEVRVFDELMCPSAQKVLHQFKEVYFEFSSDGLPDDVPYVRKLYDRLLGDITDEEFKCETESFARMRMQTFERWPWLNWMLQDKSSLREQMREVQLKRVDIEWQLNFEPIDCLISSNAYEDCHVDQTTARLMKDVREFFLNKLQHQLDICDIKVDESDDTLTVSLGKMWY